MRRPLVLPVRLALALSLGVVAGCASAGTTPSNVDHGQTILTNPDGRSPGMSGSTSATLVAQPTTAVDVDVAAEPARVYAALKQAYASIGVPTTIDDPAGLRIGNADFYKSHQIGGERLSKYVECGMGMTGPRADSYRIYMSLISTVTPANGGKSATVHTKLVASGVDLSTSGSDRIPCGSTGALEGRLNGWAKNAVK